MFELSVIVPTLNDARRLAATLESLDQVVSQLSLNAEVIVVDDESEDDTLEVAAGLIERHPSLHLRVFRRARQRRGFGQVVRYGMAHATGRFCALVSADGKDPVDLLPELLKRLRAGAHHVQVSRYLRPEDEATVSGLFRLYQTVYRWLIRITLREEIQDSTFGFRAFDRIYVQALGISSARFNVCPEMTFKVLLSGGKLEYVPGHPAPYGTGGSKKFELPHESWGYAYVLGRAWLHRFGFYWF
jgi:glycosyltransferase involved in cell wall biosynthesis